jgi:SAM-dependent methyltransferase
VREADEWNNRYVEERTGWDLGEAPASLRRVVEARSGEGKRLSVLVPGAGRGHDARAWAAAGHEAVAVDFAPLAIEEGRKLAAEAGLDIEFVEADVSALPEDWTDRFDVVWEQTCLCAIPVDLRKPYVKEVQRVLKPDGEFVAVLWNHGRDGGPPFDMHVDAVMDALDGRFEVLEHELVPDSPKDRVAEWLWTMKPKA